MCVQSEEKKYIISQLLQGDTIKNIVDSYENMAWQFVEKQFGVGWSTIAYTVPVHHYRRVVAQLGWLMKYWNQKIQLCKVMMKLLLRSL